MLLSHGEEEDYLSNQGKVPAGPPTPRSRGKAGTYFSKRPLVPLQIRLRRKLLLASGKPLSLRVAIPDRFSTTAGPVADNLHRRRDFACSLTTDNFFSSVAQHGFKIDWRAPPRPPRKSARDARPLVGEQAVQFNLEHLRMARKTLSGGSDRPTHLQRRARRTNTSARLSPFTRATGGDPYST